MSEQPWYADGLRFACTRCGNCCTGAPGSVRVSDAEIEALAAHLALDEADMRERFTRRLDDGAVSLTEKPNHDCVFWHGARGCIVYAVRPTQCRTWPFWRRNLASPEHWAAAASTCPGMDSGPLHDAQSIARSAQHDGTSGTVPESGEENAAPARGAG